MGVYQQQPQEYWVRHPWKRNKKQPIMNFVQFVPGYVVSVVTGKDSPSEVGINKKLGSITARPHITDDMNKDALLKGKNRYYPLLRGMHDIPTVGDPVLLCDFGGIQYYLGPLNTEGSPNFNDDFFAGGTNVTSDKELGAEDTPSNKKPLFQKEYVSRLEKRINPALDDPNNRLGLSSTNIHGDMIFEGRHGNSIRIGSRWVNPYMLISNGRNVDSTVETTLDGTLIGLFNRGTIRQHFNDEWYLDSQTQTSQPLLFHLADDLTILEEGTMRRSISRTCSTSLGIGRGFDSSEKVEVYNNRPEPEGKENVGESGNPKGVPLENVSDYIYAYDKDQLLASSGRITLNSKMDSIFLASTQFIHMGAANNINISTSKTFLVEAATNCVINTPAIYLNADRYLSISAAERINIGNILKGDVMHKAVLGDALVSMLTIIVQEMQNICYSAGAAAVNGSADPSGAVKMMEDRANALDDILGMTTVQDEETQESYLFPEKLARLILSDKVRVCK
jgi:hypothetical protein